MKKFALIFMLGSVMVMSSCGLKVKMGAKDGSDTTQVEDSAVAADPMSVNGMRRFNEAVQQKGLVLVDLWATWCGPCQSMHPVLEKLNTECAGQVRIIKVDVDKNTDIADKFGVNAIPTFILFKDGKQVWQYTGTLELRELKATVHKYYGHTVR